MASSMSKLELFSDWKVCGACGLPPKDGIKLKACTRCKSVAYHNAKCQKDHWKTSHCKECKAMAAAMQPLQELMTCPSPQWWWREETTPETSDDCDRIWQASVDKWQREDYLAAMEGFQHALQPLMVAWKAATKRNENFTQTNNDDENVVLQSNDVVHGMQIARRLLFCAYCEADGGQLELCRIRLVQCISILLECSGTCIEQSQMEASSTTISNILDDAWMEFMLSYEEVPELRRLSRHVANMAITSGQSSCGWTNPLQRPGYMAKMNDGDCPPFIPRDNHPDWCGVVEERWQDIVEELKQLEHNNQQQCWSAVGSGDRGSGGDDHRVVSQGGGKWTEYVLFGTGATTRSDDRDAPMTKRLLRQYVPDAVSLAEAGGGEVIFSRLAPKTHIEAHCGPTNLRWTAHLGLVVPTDGGKCQIRVASEWHQWQAGKWLLFDDSYEHEIINDTDETRTILLLRLWHPCLSDDQRRRNLEEACRRKELAVEKRYHPPG